MKKFLVALSLFLLPMLSFAAVQITEIMYDLPGTDTGREWIEIYNPDAASIDVSKLKLFEASTNHSITPAGASATLDPYQYAVIADTPAKFTADNPDYAGLLFDSSFSLSNTGEPLEIRDGSLNTLASITYDPSIGAGGDGNSLQYINEGWGAALPTPGKANVSAPVSSSSATTTAADATPSSQTASTTETAAATTTVIIHNVYLSAHDSPEDISAYDDGANSLSISAGRERLSYVGVPVLFSAKHKALASFPWSSCDVSWSFGDGFSANSGEVSHTYKHPGIYAVILSAHCGDMSATARTAVKVLVPNLSLAISADAAIEVTNRGSSEINLGGWKLQSDAGQFSFPRNTILAPEGTITLSREDMAWPLRFQDIFLANPSATNVVSIRGNENIAQPSAISSNIEADLGMSVAEAEHVLALIRARAADRRTQSAESHTAPAELPIDTSREEPASTDIPQSASVLTGVPASSSTGFFTRVFGGILGLFHHL